MSLLEQMENVNPSERIILTYDAWCKLMNEVEAMLNEHAALKRENETLERSNERAWDSARFFAGRNELLRLHIRCHLGLVQMECIGWSDENYRDALLKEQEDET